MKHEPRVKSYRPSTSQIKASYVPFYKSSLLFLACIDVETDLSQEERVTRAHDLGVAALLGDSIYNFGELVRTHVARAGDGTIFFLSTDGVGITTRLLMTSHTYTPRIVISAATSHLESTGWIAVRMDQRLVVRLQRRGSWKV